MSGLLGFWNLDGCPAEAGLLRRLSGSLAHRGPDGETLWIQGPLGLAFQMFRVTPESLHETQPLVDPSGVAVLFDGRLDNRDELLDGLPPDSPDSTLILAAYRTFGESFPEKLKGDFAVAVWDRRLQRLLLARDPIGMRPLYYCRAGDTFLFASEIKGLLAHPRVSTRPNDETVADFVLGFPGEDNRGTTFFQDIYTIPPAHLAAITPQRLVVRRYWNFDTTRQIRLKSFDEYREAFRHLFDQAVARRLRSAYPVAVSVSGGVDSSAVFCCAETLRRRDPDRFPSLQGFSYIAPQGFGGADEAEFLVEIERQYGVSMERLPMLFSTSAEDSREQVWVGEAPLADHTWANLRGTSQALHSHSARVLLTGNWADQILCGRFYLVDLFHRLAWGQLRYHIDEFYAWFTDMSRKHFLWRNRRFLRDLLYCHVPRSWGPLVRQLRSEILSHSWDQPWYTRTFRKSVLKKALDFRASAVSYGSSHARSVYGEVAARYPAWWRVRGNKVAARLGFEWAFPFLDQDLVAFLMAIPGEIQAWNGIPKGILREAMRPDLPERIANRRWKATLSGAANAALAVEFDSLLQPLRAAGFGARWGYWNHDVLAGKLEQWRGRLRGNRFVVAQTLQHLIGLEFWLETFFSEHKEQTGGHGNGAATAE